MKSYLETFLKEVEEESVGTRKMLNLVPSEKMDWQPHPKSMSFKALATHIADLPTWIGMALKTDFLDFAENPYQPKDCNSNADLVAYFDENITQAKLDIAEAADDILDETWTLKSGEAIYMQLSRMGVLRHTMNQMIHHRAQLGVDLRLNDIPIPGMYGPSADEM